MVLEKFKKWDINFLFFLGSILLFQLPPFYPLLMHIALLNSHSIARYILLYLVTYVLIKKRNKTLIPINKMSISIVFFFISQSLSLIPAQNWESFFSLYNRLIFGIAIYFVGLFFFNTKKRVTLLLSSLVISVAINIVYEAFIYFFPDLFNKYFIPILYEPYLDVVNNYYFLHKLFMDIFNPAFAALILYFIITYRKVSVRVFLIFLLICLIFFSIVSNFRTHLTMLTFSFISGLLLILGRRKILLYGGGLIIGVFFLYSILTNYISVTTIDRLFLPQRSDIATIDSRFTMWMKSVDMGFSSPIFGVGLGNFYDNYPKKSTLIFSLFDWKNVAEKVVLIDPHNIFFATFAQSGLIGIGALLFMLFTFVSNDIALFRKKSLMMSTTALTFWSLFIYSLLNPALSLQYFALFWVLRSILATNPKGTKN